MSGQDVMQPAAWRSGSRKTSTAFSAVELCKGDQRRQPDDVQVPWRVGDLAVLSRFPAADELLAVDAHHPAGRGVELFPTLVGRQPLDLGQCRGCGRCHRGPPPPHYSIPIGQYRITAEDLIARTSQTWAQRT